MAGPAPTINAVPIISPYAIPAAPNLPSDSLADLEALYDGERDQMEGMLLTNFASFMATYFPNTSFFTDALSWCDNAVVNGGTGINPAVEQALWERDRARIMADSSRLEDDAMNTWANRRFPLPPGALTGQVNDIRLDASRKLAESSRSVAIKSFEQEIANVQFAVKSLLDQQIRAFEAAGDYIKTLMLGPQVAMQLATGLMGLRTELARSLTALYSAEVAALDPAIRVAIANSELQMRGAEANQKAALATIDEKVKAALEGAQMLATMSAAGLNTIHAQAAISGSDSSSL